MIMNIVFYIAAGIMLVAALLAITRRSAIHGLMYLVVSLLALSVLFLVLGAPLAAALEVIVYAGAIMVLFLFVIMMLQAGISAEKRQGAPGAAMWVGPGLLALALGAEMVITLLASVPQATGATVVGPQQVGAALYGPYALGVELASVLLLAGLVAAYHVAHSRPGKSAEEEATDG